MDLKGGVELSNIPYVIIDKSLYPPGYVDKTISWRPQLIKTLYEDPQKKKKIGKETGTKMGTSPPRCL